jgi:Fur family transcriptional regulator, zinc uptake regulator
MSNCQNHKHCINDALESAQKICTDRKLRLTALREQVLRLIWQSHQPLGAYDLLDMLANASERRVAPPTVYRALEFLLDVGLIHRINSLNAYIGCPSPSTEHPSYFLICTECKTASECDNSRLSQYIESLGKEEGFTIQQQWLEVLGLCNDCQETNDDRLSEQPSSETKTS